MARNRFTLPSTERVYLSEGDWVEFKSKISYGEEQTLASASLTSVNFNAARAEEGDTEIGLDMKRHAVLRLLTWVTEWSFQDHTGRVQPISRSTIENLDPDTAAELNRALDDHIAGVTVKAPIQIIEAGFDPS